MAGEPFNESPEALDKLSTELDKIERPQPTLVKLPLNKSWEEFKELLDVLAGHNVQGLSIANLQKDRTGMSIPRDWEGGLSGSPCYEASNERIKQVYREYGDRFTIAGIGGVFTPQQAYEKIRSGSSLVMFISSLMYRGPQQITVLKRGLAELLKRDGFDTSARPSASTPDFSRIPDKRKQQNNAPRNQYPGTGRIILLRLPILPIII